MANEVRIKMGELPLRPRALELSELSKVFGGGATCGSGCSDGKDCSTGSCDYLDIGHLNGGGCSGTRTSYKRCCKKAYRPSDCKNSYGAFFVCASYCR